MFSLYYPSLKAEIQNLIEADTPSEIKNTENRLIKLWTEAGMYTLAQVKQASLNKRTMPVYPEVYTQFYTGKTLGTYLLAVLDMQQEYLEG